ncbi:MAG: hypothetical protein U0X20_33735 [Caldilineaceae bacterium]
MQPKGCVPALPAKGQDMMEEQGYSQLFYVMLVLGVIGVVGFILVAAGVPGS